MRCTVSADDSATRGCASCTMPSRRGNVFALAGGNAGTATSPAYRQPKNAPM